jgi:hypothetical protein
MAPRILSNWSHEGLSNAESAGAGRSHQEAVMRGMRNPAFKMGKAIRRAGFSSGPFFELTVAPAFLDYQVIDHLHRVANGTYKGAHKNALATFQTKALEGEYELWMSEITEVEMIIGRENPKIDAEKAAKLLRKDKEKLSIAKKLGVRWVSYPCGKFDDNYSRLNVSLRFAGPESAAADAFERRIEQIANVSAGDARQVVSLVFGVEDPNAFRPMIRWFVTEDQPLHVALRREVQRGALPELAGIRIASVAEFIGAA